MFSSWFNRGFLVLRRIDWSTPASILERIIRYEAVHRIRGWEDLRRRIDPPDRRCYAFFHPALVDDPLIFVEVAFTRELPDAISPILTVQREPIELGKATTAVFYSISNCQRGLAGVSFGNFLIKQVVEEIAREYPKLSTFVTLSPVPGFAEWLAQERAAESTRVLAPEDRAALSNLDTPGWWQVEARREPVKEPLLRAAAWYFLHAKTSGGTPLDAVARFHLGNGARLERINWLADASERGMAPVARADGELSLRSRRHREEPRGLCAAAHRCGVERGDQARARALRSTWHRLLDDDRCQDFPYTGTIAPRVTLFSGEARNRIVAATSSTFGQAAWSAFGMASRFTRVSMIEGATALTRMPSLATSSASATVSAATAALLAV